MRKLRWPSHYAELPKHPYRDTAIIYGCMAAIVPVLGAATGRSLWKTAALAAGFFFAATAYGWWRVRQKIDAQEKQR